VGCTDNRRATPSFAARRSKARILVGFCEDRLHSLFISVIEMQGLEECSTLVADVAGVVVQKNGRAKPS